ncbi:bifunctional riboflavin kinase/FAD synthetase [Desulfoscipio gibsoniae]|uniref:Riboflavin biosynthesis protein n=1 Tax=Desulfoscipio gibsoniae DSM 7213 TaxID=767817 RepID=R4KNT8_9FIRM|nr:bifunctional riboflavin kinase/FAD synthetase [Desulfoscipio gibsoniae]AGL01296.1 riboflavin kinase/FMN adenylyltransferase [Desulfoscipio gibsoniae DSM 7213]
MRIYKDWVGLKDKYKDIVVGLGNFDGIHLGHQRLIGDLVAKSQAVGGTPTVFTFVPHPLAVLNPQGAPPLILPPDVKRNMFAELGVEVLLWIPFTLEFARLSPEDFIKHVLHDQLGVRAVIVGYNYTFGHMGRGTPELLKEYGEKLGFDVVVLQPVSIEGQPVSSTLIRSLLADGEISEARKYLGYSPVIEGTVVYGERRGSTLGFPTANIEVEHNLLVPANGVYSVKVDIDGQTLGGVANIGVKPTFHGNTFIRTIEVHLLDFCGDLYGKLIRVYFIRRLRNEKRFNSAGELIEQIQRDIHEARIDSTGAGC